MRILTFFVFAIVCFFTTAGLNAQTTVAARLSVKDSFFKTIQDKCRELDMPIGDKGIREIEAFLLPSPPKTLVPVILLKATPALIEKMSNSPIPISMAQRGEWYVCTLKDNPEFPQPQASTINDLLQIASAPSPYPFYIEATPPVICDIVRRLPQYQTAVRGTSLEVILEEFSSINKLEIRTTTNATSFRIIALFTTRAGSPLNTLLSQRLPATLPAEHGQINTAGAILYGYSVYNPSSIAEYLNYLSGRLSSCAFATSKKLSDCAGLLATSSGYVAFTARDLNSPPLTYHAGHWDSLSAPKLLKAEYGLGLALMSDAAGKKGEDLLKRIPSEDSILKEAFKIGDIPVWKLSYEDALMAIKRDEKTAFPPLSAESDFSRLTHYCALRNGSLLMAANPEAITNFVQAMEHPTSSKTMDKAFTHYPTVIGQFKYDSDRLLKMLNPTDEVSVNQWLNPCPPIYIAASISKGQEAFTVDIPLRFFEEIGNIIKKQRASKQMPTHAPKSGIIPTQKGPAPLKNISFAQ